MKMNKTLVMTSLLMSSTVLPVAAADLGARESVAEESPMADYEGTAWGAGIGTVLGAVIAGPPGAAIGATLGGSVGWGQDQASKLDTRTQSLTAQSDTISQLQASLQKSQQRVNELARANALKSAQLADVDARQRHQQQQDQDLLDTLKDHYVQEVYFRFGEATLPDYAQSRLDALADLLQAYPRLTVSLRGFTDRVGSLESNLELARSRMESVRDYLGALNIAPERFEMEAMGESQAVAKLGDIANTVLDRRVAIELSLANDVEQPLAALGESSP